MPRITPLFLLIFLCPIIALAQATRIKLKFADGQIKAGFNSKGGQRQFTLETIIPTTVGDTNTKLISFDSTGMVTRKHIRYFNHSCMITNTVRNTSYGLQWDIEIDGEETSWTAPIETQLQFNDPATLQFWTTWADNHTAAPTGQWQDPFLPAKFQDLKLVYGGDTKTSRDAFVSPVASIFLKNEDTGLSFIQSPDDTILSLEMRTSATGVVAYRHLNHRIGNGHTINIRHQLVLHEADWRAGVSWMVENYKQYFVPEEPLVNKIAGCGAYSSYEGELDTARYRRMGLSINWKASLDFPYMGMYIPPIKDNNEQWNKYRQYGVTVGDGYASVNRLNHYSEHFNTMGFYTLSYFNVNEFGNGIVYPFKTYKVAEDQLWKNANNFLYTKFKNAFLKPAGMLPEWDERPVFSDWEDCIVLDPADSAYRAHLLGQAKLLAVKIPASSGICIDRLDWMRYYNSNADDSISMVGQQKTRALILSWKEIMEPIGKLMHDAHKVIFCNPLYRRIDMMAHIDGIYDEYGYVPSSLNLCAQMALLKPIIAWTSSKDDLMPDPDAYFQRHLYLGAFLTVPFPGNDHCIQPDAWAEKYYTDYGMLLSAIKGREWVLYPHVVEVENETAKANVFKANGKIIIPVVLGGSANNALVIIRLPFSALGKQQLQVKVLYPGAKNWKMLGTKKYAKIIKLPVALKRGCALICIGYRPMMAD